MLAYYYTAQVRAASLSLRDANIQHTQRYVNRLRIL